MFYFYLTTITFVIVIDGNNISFVTTITLLYSTDVMHWKYVNDKKVFDLNISPDFK